ARECACRRASPCALGCLAADAVARQRAPRRTRSHCACRRSLGPRRAGRFPRYCRDRPADGQPEAFGSCACADGTAAASAVGRAGCGPQRCRDGGARRAPARGARCRYLGDRGRAQHVPGDGCRRSGDRARCRQCRCLGRAARNPTRCAGHRRVCWKRGREMSLELKRISTGYEATNVIHDIDLSVGAGEIIALVGANGAGKSTLVKAISGIVPVRRGEITLDGKRIDRTSPAARVLMGIAQVPEGRQVFAGLTVRENLRLGGYARGAESDPAAFEKSLAEIGKLFPILLQRLDEPAANLSGGQQQMLAIGRGLMAEPRILVLDEPSLGLAPVLVAEIFRLVASLRGQGRGILLSEQNAKLSLAIADRAYVIENGRVALSGTGEELLHNSEVAERYLGVGKGVSVADPARHAQLPGRLSAILGR